MLREHTKIIPKKPEDRAILERVAHSISIAEALNECLWLGDKYHRTIYINPVYEKTSGYSLREAIGRQADFCFDEATKKTIAEHHKLRAKGISSQYEGTMISKSGKKIPLLISGAPTTTGGTIGIFINLTRVKKLARQEKIAQQILRYSEEALVILDKNRKVKLWNNGATKIFGYREEEILGKSISTLIPPDLNEENQELLKEVEMKGHLKNRETKRMGKNGESVDVSLSVTKIVDEKKHFIAYLVIYRDITQQKRIGTELQKRFETIQDAYKELGLQRRHLDYMYEIIDAAVSKGGIENLERLIVSALCLLTKCDGAVLRIFDEKRKMLRLTACFGVSPKWWDKSQIKFENSIAEDAFNNKRPLIIDDIDIYSKHQGTKLLKTHKFKTLVLIPMIVENKFLGSISLYTTDPVKFRMIETDFLENMGKQCALALFVKKSVHKN